MTIYYVKAGRSETAAKLDLELVPTQDKGKNLFRLLFNAPLPNSELRVIGPSKWEKPLVTRVISVM